MTTVQQRRPVQGSNENITEKVLQANKGSSDTTPVVPASVIKTLLGFTAAMAVVPIGSYFLTVDLIFRGNKTLAGGLAALMANVVLFGYVFVAWREDQEDQKVKSQYTGVHAVDTKKAR